MAHPVVLFSLRGLVVLHTIRVVVLKVVLSVILPVCMGTVWVRALNDVIEARHPYRYRLAATCVNVVAAVG